MSEGTFTGTQNVPDEPAPLLHVGEQPANVWRLQADQLIKRCGPVTDQTQSGGVRRIQRHLSTTEREKYLRGNYRLRVVT